MEITSFGVFWLGISCVLLFLPIRYMVGWLIFACIFESCGVFSIQDRSLLPFVCTQVFLVIRALPLFLGSNIVVTNKILTTQFWFVAYAVCCTLILPIFFENSVKVYAGEGGIDGNFFSGGILLSLSSSNFVQVVFLLLSFSSCFIVVANKNRINFEFLYKVFLFSIFFVVIFGFWEYFSKMYGVIPFPKEFFINNTSSLSDQTVFDDKMRLNSTFLEASYAGDFIAAAFWASVAIGKKWWSLLLCLLLIVALTFNLSGTGILTFMFGSIVYICFNNFKHLLLVVCFAIIIWIVLFSLGNWQDILILVGGKSDSTSGEVRFGAAVFTLNLFLQTYCLGVGLGSHRGSSFLLNLLASVGLAGTIFFVVFFGKAVGGLFANRKIDYKMSSVLLFAIVLMFGQIIAIPDLSFTPMWMWIIMLMSANFKPSPQ